MRKAEAIASAVSFARENGYDPEMYDIHADTRDLRWVVHFRRKSDQTKPRPGDFFIVEVNIRSKSVERLIPGK
jgi:hypothetical protein